MVPEYSSSWTQEIVQAFACACNPLGSGGGGSGGGEGGRVLRISSGGIDRRIFWGLKFRNFFFAGEFGKYFLGWFDLSRGFLGYLRSR